VAEVIIKYFDNRFKKSLETSNVPKEYLEGLKSFVIDEDKVVNLIKDNPRALFDVFDENSIRINIVYDYPREMFKWGINSFTSEERYPSRIEAEHASVKVAFATLEDKLLCIRDTNKLNA
jgi:hypothetical protein